MYTAHRTQENAQRCSAVMSFAEKCAKNGQNQAQFKNTLRIAEVDRGGGERSQSEHEVASIGAVDGGSGPSVPDPDRLVAAPLRCEDNRRHRKGHEHLLVATAIDKYRDIDGI